MLIVRANQLRQYEHLAPALSTTVSPPQAILVYTNGAPICGRLVARETDNASTRFGSKAGYKPALLKALPVVEFNDIGHQQGYSNTGYSRELNRIERQVLDSVRH